MAILYRCLLAFGLLLVIGAAASVTTVLQVSSLSGALDMATVMPLRQVDGAWRAWEAFRRADQLLAATLAGLRDETQTQMVADFTGSVAPIQAELARAFPPDAIADHTKVDRLRQQIAEWQANALVLLGGTAASSIPTPHVMDQQSEAIGAALQGLIADEVIRAAAAHTAISAKMSETQFLAVAFALASIGLGVGVAIPLGRSLSRPLQQLQQRMRDMMDGNMDGPIAGESRKDAVGDIARALGFMRQRLTERQRLQNEAAMASLVDEQAKQAKIAGKAAAEQSLVVSSVRAGLEHMAKGELAYRLTEAFPADYDELRTNFNATISSLQDVIGAIAGSTGRYVRVRERSRRPLTISATAQSSRPPTSNRRQQHSTRSR